MSRREEAVPRPIRSTEYTIRHATAGARKGWRDIVATQKNAAVEAWQRLTTDPTSIDGRCHPLKGDLATVTHDRKTHAQWQYELTGGARIWFYVSGQEVHLIAVHTHHPNATK